MRKWLRLAVQKEDVGIPLKPAWPPFFLFAARSACAALVCLSICLAVSSEAKAAAVAAGNFSIVRGGVTIDRPGPDKVTDVRPGTELLVGDVITIGEGADAQLVLPDSAFVNLAPGSALRVNQYSFDPGSERRMIFVRLMRGKVRFVVYNRMSRDSSVIVETDSAVVRASGTVDFVMNVTPEVTEALTLSGTVRVNNSSEFVIGAVSLGENRMTSVKAKAPPSDPVIMTGRRRKEYIRQVRQSR